MISVKTHSIVDYVLGVLLIAAPFVFGMTGVDTAPYVFWTMGAGLIIYSLLTDYDYSVAKLIPVSVHMALDVVFGISLVLAPLVLDYQPAISGGQYFVHWIFGLGTISLVALTLPPREEEVRLGHFDEAMLDQHRDDYNKAA